MNFAWIVADWSAVSSVFTVIALTYWLPALLVGLVVLIRLTPERERVQQTLDGSK